MPLFFCSFFLTPELCIYHCKGGHIHNLPHITLHLKDVYGFSDAQQDGTGNLATPDFLHHFISNISGTKIGENNGVYPPVTKFTKRKLLHSQSCIQRIIHLHFAIYHQFRMLFMKNFNSLPGPIGTCTLDGAKVRIGNNGDHGINIEVLHLFSNKQRRIDQCSCIGLNINGCISKEVGAPFGMYNIHS